MVYNSLIDTTHASKEAMRSKKAHELLSSCYRLLLKINPHDEAAHRGLRDLAVRWFDGVEDPAPVWEDVFWALLNSREFIFNH